MPSPLLRSSVQGYSLQKAQRALFRPVLNGQSYGPTFRRLLLLLLLKRFVNCVWDRGWCLKARAFQEALVSIRSPIQNRMFPDVAFTHSQSYRKQCFWMKHFLICPVVSFNFFLFLPIFSNFILFFLFTLTNTSKPFPPDHSPSCLTKPSDNSNKIFLRKAF